MLQVGVQLSDEQKFLVLLAAFCCFLVALFCSLCLACPLCPLNVWLARKQLKRRYEFTASLAAQQQAAALAATMLVRRQYNNHQSRLGQQSIELRVDSCNKQQQDQPPPPDYQTALRSPTGDYFHQHQQAPVQFYGQQQKHEPPPPVVDCERSPVRLKVLVKLLEPGELVERAISQSREQGGSLSRQSSASSQLSLPHLFGSLVGSLSPGGGSRAAEPIDHVDEEQPAESMASSTSSQETTSSSSDSRPVAVAIDSENKQQQQHSSATIDHDEANSLWLTSPIASRMLHMNVASLSYARDESAISTKKHRQANSEQLQHLTASNNETKQRHQPQQTQQQQQQQHQTDRCQLAGNSRASKPPTAAPATGKQAKSFQLLICVSDIENVLQACQLDERSCSLLASQSQIYVQCELLAPRSTSARLLRPLRALTGNSNNNSQQASSSPLVQQQQQQQLATGDRLTVSFASQIPAALATTSPGPIATSSSSATTSPLGSLAGCEQLGRQASSLPPETNPVVVVANNSGTSLQRQQQRAEPRPACWRHENSTGLGSSLVAFSSVPKQVFATSAGADHFHRQQPDMVQFDGVFVGPIMSRSLLEESSLRFRVFGQAKHVNETCLAELQLQLRSLIKPPSGQQDQQRDNLNDLNEPGLRPPSNQTDLIINNVLSNLLTASCGLPLASLLQQQPQRQQQQQSEHYYHSWSTCDAPSGVSLGSPSEHEQEQLARLIEQNYCRSVMVSHWLNYLPLPAYECKLVQETRARLILGLTYLPTSNRIIFYAHRATIEPEVSVASKSLMKKLQLATDTCYLLRFYMVSGGQLLRTKSTQVGKRPEWDSQEPLTFDLVAVASERPKFIVALVARNSSMASSLQNLGSRQSPGDCSSCAHASNKSVALVAQYQQQQQQQQHERLYCNQSSGNNNHSSSSISKLALPSAELGVQSEPESARLHQKHELQHNQQQLSNITGNNPSRVICCSESSSHHQRASRRRDLVLGHLVLGEHTWRELRAQPRKQIVRSFTLS